MYPRPLCAVGRLKGTDFVVALQRQRDFIETLQQRGAPARVDLEMVPRPRGRDDGLLLQIDANAPCPLGAFDLRGETIDDFLVDHDGENTILKAVREKDVDEA